jgi:hypothetical protein
LRDGEVPSSRGDNAKVAVGSSSLRAFDGKGVCVDLLAEEDEGGIIRTFVGGGAGG